MSDNPHLTRNRSEVLLTAVLERLDRIEHVVEGIPRLERRVSDVAADVDAIDRFNRPYGDGTRAIGRRRRAGR